MNGVLYTVSKKPNSTAQPSGGTPITFALKGACSVQAPVLALKGGAAGVELVSAFDNVLQCYIGTTGYIYDGNLYNVTNAMPVHPGQTYDIWIERGGGNTRYCWYDINGEPISGAINLATGTVSVTAPSGAAYLRISYRRSDPGVSVLETSSSFSVQGFNYLYIPSWSRYYWITDITYALGEWILSCKCDVLASYKSQIGASSQYVLRSASAYDEYIVDALYPAKTPPDVTTDPAAVSIYSAKGTYILGVAGQGGLDSSKGGLTYYALSPAQMQTFQRYLHQNAFAAAMAGDFASALAIAVQDVAEQFTHIFEYIRSCMWLPINYLPGSATPIYIGEYTFVDSGGAYVMLGHELDDVNTNFTISHTVTAHPQAATEGAWLNSRPFKHMTLTAPGLGSIDLSPDVFRAGDTVDLWCDLSLIDGSIQADLYRNMSTDGRYLGRYTGAIGVQIPLSQMANDPLAFLTSVHNAVQTFNSQFDMDPVGAVLGAAGQFANAASAICPQPAQLTPAGAGYHVSGDSTKSRLTTICYRIVDTDNTSHGRPLCQVKQISTLSGYVLCENAEISIPGTKQEADEVMNFMNGGFYYE